VKIGVDRGVILFFLCHAAMQLPLQGPDIAIGEAFRRRWTEEGEETEEEIAVCEARDSASSSVRFSHRIVEFLRAER